MGLPSSPTRPACPLRLLRAVLKGIYHASTGQQPFGGRSNICRQPVSSRLPPFRCEGQHVLFRYPTSKNLSDIFREPVQFGPVGHRAVQTTMRGSWEPPLSAYRTLSRSTTDATAQCGSCRIQRVFGSIPWKKGALFLRFAASMPFFVRTWMGRVLCNTSRGGILLHLFNVVHVEGPQ